MTETVDLARPRVRAPLFPRLPGPTGSAEAYRNLASRVESRLRSYAGHSLVIAITSPETGSGKTITSLNLALALERLTTTPTAIIEADLWRPTFREYFSYSAHDGLAQYLADDQASIEDYALTIEGTKLTMVPSGVRPSSPLQAEDPTDSLLTTSQLQRMLDDVRRHYGLIILDSAPWFTSSAYRIAEVVDAVVLVVRANHSRRAQLDRAVKELGPNKLLGVTFNADPEGAYRYASYY